MGCDIHGWVEVHKSPHRWVKVIDVDWIIERNYYLFACLFDQRNYLEFPPLFGGRGIPEDYDQYACEWNLGQHDATDFHSITWCTYEELSSIDLTVQSTVKCEYLIKDRLDENGEARRLWHYAETPEEKAQLKVLSRADALDTPDFKELMELMGVLAKWHGADQVRWIVYFDN